MRLVLAHPFHPARDGFVVGEGAAFAVLGPREGIHVAGVGRSLDAHHLTKPHPDGLGARLAMSQALHDAGTRVVDVVAAHGTGTPLNDEVERAVIDSLCPNAEILAVKGALGHWVAGAGTLNLLCAHEVLRSGHVPPVHGNPDFPLRTGTYRTAVVNAFAFGGANSSAVLCV